MHPGRLQGPAHHVLVFVLLFLLDSSRGGLLDSGRGIGSSSWGGGGSESLGVSKVLLELRGLASSHEVGG